VSLPGSTFIDEPVAAQRPQIIGTSSRLREALARADRVAPASRSVLIYGESGTGKELPARRIHEKSKRAAGPFVAVNCAAISRELLESELFGHERGAFTGAHQARAGFFEQAHGGTLFLDEVGDMALEHQTKVLRALQEGEVLRVGASQLRRVDVRVVAATNRDLGEAVAQRLFREDLLYRLARYQIRLPALRERGEDVQELALAILAREFPGAYFTEGAREFLRRHTWPGNIRELEDVVGAAAIDARDGRITEKELEANLVVRGRGAVPLGVEAKTGGGASVDATTASATATETAIASAVGRVGAESPAAATRPRKREDEGERREQPQDSAQPPSGRCEVEFLGRVPRPLAEDSGSRAPADTRLDAVLAFIKAHGQITAAEVRELLRLQRSQGLRVLKSWERQGKIAGRGGGRGVNYVLPGTGATASLGPRNESGEGEGQRDRELEVAGVRAQATAPARLAVALKIVADAGMVTRAEYAKAAMVSQRTAKRDLAELVSVGKLRAEGNGRSRGYVLGRGPA
jgi:DNA-binding NtrC family response regulator